MSAEHLPKKLVLMCIFFSISLMFPFNHMGDITFGILEYAPILHISASSQSANNKYLKLKIQVTRTPFQIWI